MRTPFKITAALVLGLTTAGVALAGDEVVVSTMIGGGAGALIGGAVGGRNGAVVGGVIGAATGAAVASNGGYYRHAGYVYAPAPVVVAPPPVYYPPVRVVAPPPAYYPPGYGYEVVARPPVYVGGYYRPGPYYGPYYGHPYGHGWGHHGGRPW